MPGARETMERALHRDAEGTDAATIVTAQVAGESPIVRAQMGGEVWVMTATRAAELGQDLIEQSTWADLMAGSGGG